MIIVLKNSEPEFREKEIKVATPTLASTTAKVKKEKKSSRGTRLRLTITPNTMQRVNIDASSVKSISKTWFQTLK